MGEWENGRMRDKNIKVPNWEVKAWVKRGFMKNYK
jgi:hypothetical protein